MKNKIDINVEVTYLPNQSNIPGSQYAFAYTITITNHGETGAQLRTRRWLIQDETGQIEEVVGEGVVGPASPTFLLVKALSIVLVQ